MKTIVQKLGKSCRRWLLALSLAWVGVGMAGASIIASTKVEFNHNGNSHWESITGLSTTAANQYFVVYMPGRQNINLDGVWVNGTNWEKGTMYSNCKKHTNVNWKDTNTVAGGDSENGGACLFFQVTNSGTSDFRLYFRSWNNYAEKASFRCMIVTSLDDCITVANTGTQSATEYQVENPGDTRTWYNNVATVTAGQYLVLYSDGNQNINFDDIRYNSDKSIGGASRTVTKTMSQYTNETTITCNGINTPSYAVYSVPETGSVDLYYRAYANGYHIHILVLNDLCAWLANPGPDLPAPADPMAGLTKLAGPFLISGGQTGSEPNADSDDYAYANNGIVSVTQNVGNPSGLNDNYKWDIYTDNNGDGGQNHFTIVNVGTGQFLNIPSAENQDITLVATQSETTHISLYNYTTSANATGAEAAAGLGNVNIQNNRSGGNNGKGYSNGTKFVTRGNTTGHFKFTLIPAAPAAPTGLTATANSATQITLSWTASAGATGYKVYDNNGTQITTNITINGTTAVITGLTANTSYTYKVKATNAGGDSDFSSTASATTLPNAPTGLTATANSATQITLSWTASTGATGYKVYDNNGTQITTNITINGTTAVITGLTANTSYTYKVKATNAGGDSDFSSTASATTLPNAPAAPAGLTATANSASQITLSWTASANATGYKVFRSTTENGEYTQIATPSTNSYNNTGLSANTTYYYKVKATNTGGDSNFSSTASATTCPAAPTGLAISGATHNSVTLSWTEVAGATGYKVYDSGDNEVASVNTNTATINNLSAYTRYTYYVKAEASCTSPESDNITVRTQPAPLASFVVGAAEYYRSTVNVNYDYNAATDMPKTGAHINAETSAGAYIGGNGYDTKVGQIPSAYTGTAKALTTANYNNVGGIGKENNNERYAVYRINPAVTGKYKVTLLHSFTAVSANLYTNTCGAAKTAATKLNETELSAPLCPQGNAPNSWTNYCDYSTVVDLTAGPQDFIVEWVNTKFNMWTIVFESITIPAAPTDVAATASGTSAINLTWTAPTGADSYIVYRSATENGEYLQIATPNTNSYSDTGLTANTTYYYKVKATNAGGDSDFSSAASATTLPNAPAAPTGLTATANSASQITLSWTASAGATGYKVYDNNGDEITANITIDGTTAVITGLTANMSYTYKVKATNTGGDSDFSSTASATTFVSVPSAPNVTISNVSSSHLKLNWGAVTNAEKYEIYRKVGNGAYGATPYKVIDASKTSFTDNNLTFGTQYCYKLKTVGNNSANSVTVGAMEYNAVHAEGENGVAFLQNVKQSDERYNAGNIDNNEWAQYTVNVPVAGTYDVSVWMARDQGSLTAYLNDEPDKNTPLVSFVDVPTSSDWQNYNEYKSSITLAAGENTIYFVAGSGLNLWKMVFSRGAQSSDFSTEQCATTTVPPANVTLTPLSVSSIQVTWNAVDGATEYKVYRNTNATNGDGTTVHNYTCVTPPNTLATSFTDTGLTTGTIYYYTVSAMIDGEETDPSLPKNMAPIEAVPVLLAELHGEDVQLTWTYSGTDSPTFRVLRSSTENGTYEVVATGQTSSYTDTGAAANLYYYKVQAERHTTIGGMDWLDRSCGDLYHRDKGYFKKDNCSNKGNWCNAGSISGWAKYTVYSGQPDSVILWLARDQAQLTAYLNDESNDTTPLVALVNMNTNSNWQSYVETKQPITLSTAVGSSTDLYMVAGTGFNFWKMQLRNNATPSAAVQAILAAPANVTATAASTTSITVTWNAVPEATSYTVYKSTDGTTWDEGTNVNGTSYLHENLDINTIYYYKVTATDGTDTSVPSAVATGVTCPDAPTGISVETYDNHHVDVSWTAVGNGTPYHVYASGNEITGFSNLGTDKTTYNNGADYQQLTETSARIYLNNPAKHYWFAVATVQVSGCQRVMSNVASTYTAPNAPTGLTAALAANGVSLSWTAPAAPPAGAYHYRVYRAASADGQYEQVLPAAQDPVITSTSAVDNTVSAGTVYYYKVVAVMQDVESAMTDAVVIRTQPAAIGGCGFNIDPTSYYRSSYNEAYQTHSYNDADLDKSVLHMQREQIGNNDHYYNGEFTNVVNVANGQYMLGRTGANRWTTYRINVAKAGTYRVTVVASDDAAVGTANVKFNFYKNTAAATFDSKTLLTSINEKNKGNNTWYNGFFDYTSGTFELAAGVQDFILEFAEGAYAESIAAIILREDLGTLGLTATAANDIQVNLAWNDLGEGVTYTLERSNDDTADNVPDGYAQRWSGTSNYYIDNDGPVRSSHYYYRLSATTATCATALTETVDVTTMAQVPRITKIEQESDEEGSFLSVCWSYAVDEGESQPTSYKVYRAPSNWTNENQFVYIGEQNHKDNGNVHQFYHDRAVEDNQEYCYRVTAYYEGSDASKFTFFTGNYKNVGVNNDHEVIATTADDATVQWQKIPAGTNESGKSLYYLKNVSTKEYLCITGNRLGANADWYYYKTATTATNEETDQYKWMIFDNPGRANYQIVVSNYNYEGGSATTANDLNKKAYILTNFNQDGGAAATYSDSPSPAVNCGFTSDVANNVWHTVTETTIASGVGTETEKSAVKCSQYHQAHLQFVPNETPIIAYFNQEFTAEFTVKNNGSLATNADAEAQIIFGAETGASTVASPLASDATAVISYNFTAPAAAGDYTVKAQLPNGETTTRTVRVLACTPATAIALDQALATIYTGSISNTVTLTPTVTPEGYCGTIEWTSSDTNVATVSNGVVTAVAVGSATITAAINGHSATCTITVSAPVAAASVELNTYCTAADLGGTQQLTATVLASNGSTQATDQRVTWTSSDPTIATVSNTGLVTAVKSGQVYITATSVDGEYTAFAVFTSKIVKPTFTMASNYNSVTLSWTRNDGEVSYWIMARNSNNEDIYFGGMNATGSVGDVQTYTVKTMNRPEGQGSYTDLQPETTYKFQLRAFNDNWKKSVEDNPVGCGNHDAYSDWLNFATTAAPTALSVNPTVYNLLVGEQAQIGYTVTPEQLADGFISANPSIATVDALGKITAVAIGTTTITVTAGEHTETVTVNVQLNQPEFTNVVPTMDGAVLTWDNNGASYVEIYVAEDDCLTSERLVYSGAVEGLTGSTTLTGLSSATDYCVKIKGCTDNTCAVSSKNFGISAFTTLVAPVSIEISGPNKVYVESTGEYTATVSPAEASQDVVWSITSGSDYADVDAETGVVTGVADGVITLRATSAVLNTVYAEKNVTVMTATVEDMTLSRGSVYILVGGTHALPSVTFYPEGFDASGVNWTGGDAAIATITGSTINGIAEGETTFTATSAVNSNVSAELTVYVIGGGCHGESAINPNDIVGGNLQLIAGPFTIRNGYTGEDVGNKWQYLYDTTTNNSGPFTEATHNDSPSDETEYSNAGHVLRTSDDSDNGSAYGDDPKYQWYVYSYTINNNTYHMLRNAQTGRFMHTGVYGDYYDKDGNNNSINTVGWNTTNISGATDINNSSNPNKELSYYMFTLTSPSNTGFTSTINTKRFAWGDRKLHGQHHGLTGHETNYVYATDNGYNWETKNWVFTKVNSCILVDVTGFAVAPHSAEIYMGQAFQDTLKFTPVVATIQEVDWTVKGSSVEVSADGTITGVDMGTSTVYATTKDGRFVDSTVVRVLPSCDPMIVYTPVAPTMDGELDAIWDNAQPKAIMKTSVLDNGGDKPDAGASNVATDIPAGFWRLMYDNNKLYVYVQVNKESGHLHRYTTENKIYFGDAIEFYLYTATEKPTPENVKGGTNYANYAQLIIDYSGAVLKGDNGADLSASCHAQTTVTPSGYDVEFEIPWSAFTNSPVEQGYIFMEMGVDQTIPGRDKRDAQVFSYSNSAYLYVNAGWFTKVDFFKLDVPAKYVVDEGVTTTIRPDVMGVESFRWVKLVNGEETETLSNRQDLTVNTNKEMKVRLYVTQKGSCFTTYQDIDIKLSDVHLLSTPTGEEAVSETESKNISSGKGNKMSSVNCNGRQGEYSGDYAMLYLVPANTNLRSSLGVQYEGDGVTLASVNGAEATPDDGNSRWVRYLYTATDDTHGTLNIGVFPVNADVKLYNNSGAITEDYNGDAFTGVRDGYIYTWVIGGSQFGTGVFPSLDGTNTVWGSTTGVKPAETNGLKYKVTYNLLTNCMEIKELITYGLTIGEGVEEGAAVAFNEDPDLEGDGDFYITVPCVQTMAVLCYRVANAGNDLTDWKNLDYYTIDLSAFAGKRVKIPFSYMNREEWGITPVSEVFGTPEAGATISKITISGIPSGLQTELSEVCPTVTGVSDNAVYYWMKSVGSSDYEISYIPQDSTCFTPDAGYNESERTHYYLQVVDGYCSQRSGVIDYQLAYTPSASPDLAVNNLSVDWSANAIQANVQNYGENDVTKAQYTLKYTVLNISDETSKTITASTAVKQDMNSGANWTWEGNYTFLPGKAYQVTATIAFTSASKLVDAVPTNNSRTVDVCTFVPGDTVYYTIKNTLVNNVDSLCTLHFKTIGGALKHLKSPEGYLSQSGTTRTLTKPVVFNVYYTGKPYREGTDEVTLFGGLSDNLKSTQAFLFENINSGANAENAFIIRAAEHGLRPEVSHFIVRKSRNVIIENLEIEGSVAGDNALDIDDGKLIYFGSAKAGEFADANVTVRDCKITANGNATAAVVVSGVGDVILNNNVISNPGSNAAVDGASLKLVNAADIYVLRNNIYGATKNVVWTQNSEAVNFAHNVIWNRGVADGSLVALFNRADGQNSVGGKLSLYYNTLVVNNSSEVNTKFLDIANAEGKGMAMGSVNGHLLRLWYNNMYSVGSLTDNKWYNKDDNWKIINSDITKNNIYPGAAITPATEAGVAGLGGVADNYMSENVITLFDCGPAEEIDFPLSNCEEDALNVGEPLTTSSDVLLQAADDRLQIGGRSGKQKWTLGAHQADKDAVAVHSIIWTNYMGNNDWDTYANWIVKETMQQLNCTNTFASDLTAIIPAISGSRYMSEDVNLSDGGYYPTLNALPSKVRIDENKIADVVEIEYGGALPISKFLKANINSAEHSPRYRVFKTSLVMKGEDRQNEDWILVGPNIRPEHPDTVNGRQMISGDYYKDLLPQVFMHEVVLDTKEGTATWKDPFRDLDVAVTQDKGFAIKAPDRYSKWGYPATTYYKSQLSRWEAGSEDLEWTFTGTLEQDVHAPTFSAEGSKWTLMTNTFMGNIDVASLIRTHGGQVAVWSFNDDSKEIRKEENYDRVKTYGSFTTYNSSTASDVKIKPQHVFFYYNTGATKNVTLTEDICDFKTPTTYKDFTQGVAPSYKPTLEIRSLNGRYSSVTSIVYDAYLEEEQLGSKEFNLMKLFTGYAQTPDICSYYGADALYSQTINPSVKEVPLGVKAGEELKAVFEFSGAEDFKEVYLEDRLFGKRYDLKNTESLEFDLTEGYNQGRFYVIFEFDELDEPTTDLNESTASEIRIYTEDNENVVVSSEGADLVRIQMIDMSGKQQNIKVKSDRYNLINMSSYPAGVYTFKASTTDRTKVEKVVIK